MNRYEAVKNTSEATPVLTLLNLCKGLAIIWIVLIHWRPEWFGFGWQGVHVFIVVSGFAEDNLNTKVWQREWSSNVKTDILAGTLVALALILEAIAFSFVLDMSLLVDVFKSMFQPTCPP